ncbi:MAG: hypothetical protein AAFV43_12780 [Planctomycetota bacterium]
MFFEDFEGVPLRPPEQEFWQVPNPNRAFSHDPPTGWFRDANDVPGVNNPNVGIFEWEGWSLANKRFWTDVTRASGQPFTSRDLFSLGEGTVAVADPDRWNDLGDPANNLGFFNTLLRTPPIDLGPAAEDEKMTLVFDSSWRGGCCDDGQNFDPGGNNQTAIVRARIGTQSIELLRWESAPFNDNQTGQPTDQPFDQQGFPNEENPFFKPDTLNEQVVLDLSPLLPGGGSGNPPNGSRFALSSPAMMGGAGMVTLEFEMEGAGDDGHWAFDHVAMASYTTLMADMNLSGALDSGDFGAFALGMLDEDEYRYTYFGEFPETRGSLDSNFDFDDAQWFVDEMQMAGVSASAATALALALQGIPEPTSALMVLIALSATAPWRRSTPT